MPTFITAYSKKNRVTVDTGDHGGAKQNHKAECDVNLILAKYQKQGVITHRKTFEPQYDDATGIDFQEAMNLVISSQNMFNELPSTVRRKFNHDPGEFMAFVNKPENLPEMIKMGLATDTTPIPDAPIAVEIVNPTPTPTE